MAIMNKFNIDFSKSGFKKKNIFTVITRPQWNIRYSRVQPNEMPVGETFEHLIIYREIYYSTSAQDLFGHVSSMSTNVSSAFIALYTCKRLSK